MKPKLLIVAWFLAAATAAPAEVVKIELEPQTSSVGFTLKATLHSVHGNAEVTSGSLTLDTDNGAMSGEIVVDAVSADTGNKKRDKKMHAKVLRSADHGRIVLGVQRLEGELALTGVSNVALLGEMALLGQPHPVRIPLRIEIVDDRFTASGEFEVPYVEWGLEDPSTFVLRVAKEVQVTVEAKGTIVKPE